MRRTAYTLLLFIFGCLGLSAQFTEFRAVDVGGVDVEGQTLRHPYTGGLEAPQFQSLRLDSDDREDLIVFDRVGAKALPFIASENEDGSLSYLYKPSLEAHLPDGLNQLLLVQDLNCDGWKDLITTRIASVAADVILIAHLRVPGSSLQFEPPQPLLLSEGGELAPIHIHAYDLPVLQDINGDEQPDLLYIPIGGTYIQYYEQRGNCEALVYELRDDCWGNASYTVEADFQLQACDSEPPGIAASGCAGSVMACRDMDADGDQDLLFSGLYDEHIIELRNDGSAQWANLVSQSSDWVNDGAPLTRFPSPFFLPYSQSDQPDLVVATNLITGQGYSPYNQRLLRFEKGGETGGWVLAEEAFMLEEMLDFGFRSNVLAEDVNGDGLADLLFASNQQHPTFSYTSTIALLLNVGTAASPAFELAELDWQGLSAFNYKSIAPAMGDLNGDGRKDLLLGMENGDLRLFIATSEGYQLMQGLPLHELSLNGLSRPELVDYDADGLLDIVCGTRDGTISLLKNTGSSTSPAFQKLTDTLGGIVPSEGFYQECGLELLPKPSEPGAFWLYYGRRDGTIDLYDIQGMAPAQELERQLSGIDLGERISLQLVDLNEDGLPELLGGNARGGLEAFAAQPLTPQAEVVPGNASPCLYPNPADDQLWLELPGGLPGGMLNLYTADGQRVGRFVLNQWTSSFAVGHLPSGLYFYQIKTKNQAFSGKLVIKR